LGSFTRAAQEMALTQSAISHQIQQLEEWTGQALFLRAGRGVTLTAAGKIYAQTVTSAITLLVDGRNRIEPYGNPDSVILFCAPQFASGWFMPRIGTLTDSMPNIEFWLITDQEVTEIDRVDVDLVVSSKAILTPNVECIPIMQERAVAICGPATARRLANTPFPEVLTQAPLLANETSPDWAPWLSELRRSGLRTRRVMTTEDPHLLVAAAEQEAGIAMVSHLFAGNALAAGRVQALPQIPSFELQQLWLMKSTLPARAPVVDAVHAWILEQCLKDA
jgi:LysR family glycine cleavage system transcriptional activator